jgi:amino-acid N-acetyltransferase
MVQIKHAENQRDEIVAILSAQNLPVYDLPQTLYNFFVAIENEKLLGVVGLEIYGAYGLVRSLAVIPEHRNKGIAEKLIERMESFAVTQGLKELFLLTETAPAYFEGKAYNKIGRDEVPDEVKLSSEFSHVCPVSAVIMKKLIS